VSSGGSVRVEEVTVADAELLGAFATLLPQLSRSAGPPSAYQLENIVGSPATRLLVARDGADRIVGSLTLAVFPIPTGIRAIIEDVVVDSAARGQGVGAALVKAAIERATESGARTVDLTSRPDRGEANRLYLRMGFALRETNVYRYSLEG
jgi:ribosomal protein S18 acetylase RimI-like enzyme